MLMASSKKNDVISVAPPHSIKKFELISEYVKAWIQILMQNENVEELYILIACQIAAFIKTIKAKR